jgi:excisionase family DNA binding protein
VSTHHTSDRTLDVRSDRPAASPHPPDERPRSAHQTDDRLLLPVEEAARRLSIGRSLLYELLASGAIHSVHVGRLRRVPVAALIDFINRPVDQTGPNGPRST